MMRTKELKDVISRRLQQLSIRVLMSNLINQDFKEYVKERTL